MPNLTLTIEDTSPLIVYDANWEPGSSRTDNLLELYSEGSYMATDTNGASLAFVFSGTNVGLFGSKRPSHGFYQISVDSNVYTPANGNVTDGEGLFQTSLFSSIPLKNTFHTVQLSNTNAGSWLDLDYLTWTVPVGKDTEDLIVNTFQDTDNSFKYTPSDAWTNDPGNLGTFAGGSGHASSKSGSTVEFTFQGDAISIFGPVGPSGAPYSVAINVGNELPNDYTTKKTFFRPKMMLFHANTLGPGSHTVTLTVLDGDNTSGEPSTLAIDYAEVYTASSLGGQRLILDGASGSQLSTGAVVGITLGGVAGLLAIVGAIVLGILFYIRQRYSRTFFYGFGQVAKESGKEDVISARPFQAYSSISAESPPPHFQTPAGLQPQTSFGALTTPNTGQWPGSGGSNESSRPLINQSSTGQELIIPPGEKYRPDLIPHLQPPPQGSRPRQSPAALGAASQSISPVREETVNSQSGSVNLRIITDLDEHHTAPPPEYSQQPNEGGSGAAGQSAVPSTAASSFYVREALHGQ